MSGLSSQLLTNLARLSQSVRQEIKEEASDELYGCFATAVELFLTEPYCRDIA